MRAVLVAAVAALVLWPAAAPAQDGYLWCWNGDQVYAEVSGSSVTFFHRSAVYNCCMNPMEYLTYWEDGRMVIEEQEILVNPCWCLCCYDLSVTFDDFPPGQQTVVFRWDDEETGETMDVEIELSVANYSEMHSPVAQDGSWKSECLGAPSAVPDDPPAEPVRWDALKARYR
jgi:hypothetical protein